MNITELIERMRVFEADHEPDGWPAIRMREVSALCDSLLAQQVCIEQMREAVKNSTEHWNGHPEYERVASLQPDLSALREHDVEVVRQVVKRFVMEPSTQANAIYKYAERIRKGEQK